jgi:hypothetical protein
MADAETIKLADDARFFSMRLRANGVRVPTIKTALRCGIVHKVSVLRDDDGHERRPRGVKWAAW